jgi:hypothetical protein
MVIYKYAHYANRALNPYLIRLKKIHIAGNVIGHAEFKSLTDWIKRVRIYVTTNRIDIPQIEGDILPGLWK